MNCWNTRGHLFESKGESQGRGKIEILLERLLSITKVRNSWSFLLTVLLHCIEGPGGGPLVAGTEREAVDITIPFWTFRHLSFLSLKAIYLGCQWDLVVIVGQSLCVCVWARVCGCVCVGVRVCVYVGVCTWGLACMYRPWFCLLWSKSNKSVLKPFTILPDKNAIFCDKWRPSPQTNPRTCEGSDTGLGPPLSFEHGHGHLHAA